MNCAIAIEDGAGLVLDPAGTAVCVANLVLVANLDSAMERAEIFFDALVIFRLDDRSSMGSVGVGCGATGTRNHLKGGTHVFEPVGLRVHEIKDLIYVGADLLKAFLADAE